MRFPPVGQRGERRPCGWRPCRRRRPARRAPPSSAAHQLFERGVGGVVVARVAVARLFLAEDAVELLHGFVEVAGGGVDRGGDRDVRAGLLAVARMHGFGVNLQRSISFSSDAGLGVFQNDALLAAIAARIWSARAKSRAFLAAVRSAIRASTSASADWPRLRGGLQHVEDGIEALQEIERGRATLPARNSPESMALLASRTYSKTAARASAVFRSSFMAVGESACGGGGARGQLLVRRLRRKRSVSRRSLKLRRRSMAVAARFQAVEREVELLAVGHRGQQVADGFGRIAACPAGRAA